MKRLDELTMKLLDKSIEEPEVRELTELTETSDGREEVQKLFELESHLQALSRLSVADRVLTQIDEERRDRIEDGVMSALRELPESPSPHTSAVAGGNTFRLPVVVIGLASLAACLLIFLLQVDKSEDRHGAIVQLNPHGSGIRIVDADGTALPVSQAGEPIDLRQNETIETSQATDFAEIVYADGTRVELLGETTVRLAETSDGAKQLSVLSGVIHADVSPQPEGRPLRIITRAATLEVLGTTLGVEVREASTQLGVATGRVAMTRKVDGRRVEVEAGRYATATESANEPFQTHPFPDLPTLWSEDFENGLPVGWRTGELVDTQGAAAVQAVRSWRSDDGHFVVTSQNEWQEGRHGLCSIGETSVLHLRIRQSDFARITIMVGTRSYPPATGRIGGNLFYTKKAWNEDLPADTWKTVSVPLKEVAWHVKQGIKNSGAPDMDGLAAYLIHVTTMNQDAGLIIDRMWITNEAEDRQL